MNFTVHELFGRRWCNSQSQVQQVEADEQQKEQAGNQHGAGSEGIYAAHQVGAVELTAGLLCAADQGKCTPNVQNQRSQQDETEAPQESFFRQQWRTKATKELTVFI